MWRWVVVAAEWRRPGPGSGPNWCMRMIGHVCTNPLSSINVYRSDTIVCWG